MHNIALFANNQKPTEYSQSDRCQAEHFVYKTFTSTFLVSVTERLKPSERK